MAVLKWSIDKLEAKAQDIRCDILTLLATSGSGHSGGSLSCTDFGTALYFHELNLNPENPSDPTRDICHFSIGHVTPVIYSLLAERGYFPLKDLLQFRTFAGHLQGHPSAHDTPGLEVSAGSLGQGLSFTVGVALASKMDNHSRRVWCIMGDGEQQEGQVWEAAMSASHFRLDNLTAIIDLNRKQIDGDTADVMNIEPLADKYSSFGWEVFEVNGHDIPAILETFAQVKRIAWKPSVILAHTRMGKGVSFMENDHRWHGRPPTVEEAEEALQKYGTTYEEWKQRLQRGSEPIVAL